MAKIKRVQIIRHKIKEIEDNLRVVEENLPDDFESFSFMGLVKDGIYKKIEFCIENLIDICAIISSDLSLEIPSSEEDIINLLEKNKIISKNISSKIQEMKGFRNILVHKYGKIDDEMAFENISKGISDFSEIIEEIEKIL